MKGRNVLSLRALFAAIVSGVVLATFTTAGGAGATTTADRPVPVRGVATELRPDPTCPHDPEFPQGTNERRQLVGLTRSPFGPAVLRMSICYVFVGALGGEAVDGTFTISTLAGSLRGHAQGSVGFGLTDDLHLVLDVEHGSFLLSRIGGSLALEAAITNAEHSTFTGTVTPDLHR